MKTAYDIIIAGGGQAGLVTALELVEQGYDILLIEKGQYPFHKVCGEYVSAEVRDYLRHLGGVPENEILPDIRKLNISTQSGFQLSCEMKLGGFGISRYKLDHQLYRLAKERGVAFLLNETVEQIDFDEESFTVSCRSGQEFQGKIVVGAYGKRSGIDHKLKRKNARRRSPYLAVKMHYSGHQPSDTVSLHNFPGGYCGISVIEEQKVNFCYLTLNDVFKKYSGIEEFQNVHMSQNPHIREFLEGATAQFATPLTISQVDFGERELVSEGVLMCGDAAGLIHPLCGNGMAMAISAARLCSVQINLFLKGKISRADMEWNYRIKWEHTFSSRLKFGKLFQQVFKHSWLTEGSLRLLGIYPSMLRQIIRLTHGSPVKFAESL